MTYCLLQLEQVFCLSLSSVLFSWHAACLSLLFVTAVCFVTEDGHACAVCMFFARSVSG